MGAAGQVAAALIPKLIHETFVDRVGNDEEDLRNICAL